ncbi:FAD-dependent oxidoreductase [Nocardia takedensis]|uniref:FAD-dependent oxidoreductase n=1 Tax=Nocardia takedensis TaxID=259390 RepID=UPI003F772905
MDTALRTGRAVVVGHGIVGHQVVYELSSAARHAGTSIQILWIADRHDKHVASFGASGWHMPFLQDRPGTDDARIAEWARRSSGRWRMLSDSGLDDFSARTPSVLLTRERDVEPRYEDPGAAVAIDPADLSLPFYSRATYATGGSVVSTCTLMPRLFRELSGLPGVRPMVRHLGDIDELLEVTADFGAEVAYVAAGDRAQFLLDDKRVEGDLGVELRADLSKVPAPFDRIALVDNDHDHALTYSVPHRSCGHLCVGGTFGRFVTEAEEYVELAQGLDEPTRAPRYITQIVEEVRGRALERLPVLSPALAKGSYRIWYGLRPVAERVIAEWLPRIRTADIGVLHVGGLGNLGFTITPALVGDSLDISRPDIATEARLGRPSPALQSGSDH